MISSIEISNFKSIKNVLLKTKMFNLFCGDNASGKTSVIHSVLASIQVHNQNENFDGELLKIGDFSEIRNKDIAGDITITITMSSGEKKTTSLKNNYDPSLNQPSVLSEEPQKINVAFEDNLFYLSSSRIGVVDTYNKSKGKFGTNGEAVVGYLSSKQDKQLCSKYIRLFAGLFPDASIVNRYLDHVRFWMHYIVNEEVNLEQIPYTNQFVLTFGSSNNKHRSINTGSGLSYIFPIIVLCLGALLEGSDSSIIIIENPEVFLHPTAQIKLTDFLILISDISQMIIETHSDHILKRTLERKTTSAEVFVFNNTNGFTDIKTVNHQIFKIKPISFSEVQYRAFDLCSVDLHIILYSTMLLKYYSNLVNPSQEHSIKKFDDYLATIIPANLQKLRIFNKTTYNTLPTYIRNCIDHPEDVDPNTQQFYSYTMEEFNQSIIFMLGQL